jgi:hypothetical protein
MSRPLVWSVLIFLTLLAAGAIAIVGSSGALYESALKPYEATSSEVNAGIQGALTALSLNSVESAAKAAQMDVVREAAKKKELAPEADAAVMAGAGRLGAPLFVFLTDATGAVVARAGAAVDLPSSLAGLPVVAEARMGLARDGMLVVANNAYHLAAAPMFDGNALLGTVVQGWLYDAKLVQSICAPVGGEQCGLVVGTKTTGMIPAEAMAGSPYGMPELPVPLLLRPDDAMRFVPTIVPLYGTDNTAKVVHVSDHNAAFRTVSTAQVGIAALSLLMGLLTAALLLLAVRASQRPVHRLVEFLGQHQQGQSVGFVPEAELGHGVVLRLGKQINMLLQQQPMARNSVAPVGSGFGVPPTSGEHPAPTLPPAPAPYIPPTSAIPHVAEPMLAAVPASLPGSAPSLPGGGGMLAPTPLSGLFDGPDLPAVPSRVPSLSSPSLPVAPALPPLPPDDPPFPQPEATVAFQVPKELLQQAATVPQPLPAQLPNLPSLPGARAVSSPAPAVPQFASPPGSFGGPGERTVVAQVPQELLAQVRPTEQSGAQDAHYKEVYEQFLQTRIECGEDTSDLTYERFVAKLEKNAQMILEKNPAKGVRFQVHVKAGKAALRAVPVRD